jgi:hypothetical protein
MELITKLSGLLKATEEHFSATSSAKPITYTIRVICRVNFKTVKMDENSVVQSLIESYRKGFGLQ